MKNIDFIMLIRGSQFVGLFPAGRPELRLMVNDQIKNRNCAFVPSDDVGWVKAVSFRSAGKVTEVYITVTFLANPEIDSLVKFEEIDEASIKRANRQRIAA